MSEFNECTNCFEGKSDMDHTCSICGGSGSAPLAHIERGCYPRAEIMDNNGRVPVAFAVFSSNGNICMWSRDSEPARKLAETYGSPLVPLFADDPNLLAAAPSAPSAPVEPSDVPLPEPSLLHTETIDGYQHVRPMWNEGTMQEYGDAREAAGYARGRAEADKLAHTLMMCRETFRKYADLHAAKGTDEGRAKAAANMRIVSICDAALRGEVKP